VGREDVEITVNPTIDSFKEYHKFKNLLLPASKTSKPPEHPIVLLVPVTSPADDRNYKSSGQSGIHAYS
jgi:hypothetical protein